MAASRSTTSVKDWKRATALHELELPSGNTCLLRRPGMAKLLVMGLIPDSLTPLAEQAIKDGQALPPDDLQAKATAEIMADPQKVADAFDAFDRVTAEVVVEPRCLYHRHKVDEEWVDIPAEERDDSVIYTDEVFLEDKQAIFEFVVGGTTELESFRKQTGEPVGGVRAGQKSPRKAK